MKGWCECKARVTMHLSAAVRGSVDVSLLVERIYGNIPDRHTLRHTAAINYRCTTPVVVAQQVRGAIKKWSGAAGVEVQPDLNGHGHQVIATWWGRGYAT